VAGVGAGCRAELGADSNDVSRCDRFDNGKQTRHVVLEILQPIPTAWYYDGDPWCGEVLLTLKAAISRNQYGEPAVNGCAKEDSVAQPEPALLANGRNSSA
jgi:hypothetical protein